jgi:hypothetical protein
MATEKTKKGKTRYTVMVRLTGKDEFRQVKHDFCSTNAERYLEKYKQKLMSYGWTEVKFSNLIER